MRLFTRIQKQILFIKAKGKCSICQNDLTKGWHADHIIPFSKGGQTDLKNGQALCSSCNQKKYNKMQSVKLRPWQENFKNELLRNRFSHTKFLLHAGVGSGKTLASVIASKEFLNERWNVIVFSPIESVKEKWCDDFLKHANAQFDFRYSFKYNFAPQYKGISLTYQSLGNPANVNFLIEANIVNSKTLLILDEVHHLGESLAWAEGIKKIGEKAGFILLLTGTPERSDNNPIPFAKYIEHTEPGHYKLHVDMSYSYANSVRDKICCPVSFRRIDVKSDITDKQIIDNPKHNALFQNLLIGNSEYIKQMIDVADERLTDMREITPNAGGLIVCNTIKDAQLVGEYLEDSVVITSDESDTTDIRNFANSDKKWIISVKMISEGVDIPRLRICVYASNCTTRLFFEQVVGRIVRNRDDESKGGMDMSYFYFPNHFALDAHALDIESEIRHIVIEQETQIVQKREEYKERCIQGVLEFMEAEAGEESIINKGFILDDFKEFFKGRPQNEEARFEYKLRQFYSSNVVEKETPVLLTNQIQAIRNKIQNYVGFIFNKTGEEFKNIHYRHNVLCNIYSTKDKDDFIKLQSKLNSLKNEAERYNKKN